MAELSKAVNPEAQAQWQIAQYQAALAHLERLQDQLDSLRSTIPSLIQPLTKPQPSKAQMFTEVRKTTVNSTRSLETFRDDWTSEQTQALFARAKESESKDGDLSARAEVADFGWAGEGSGQRE